MKLTLTILLLAFGISVSKGQVKPKKYTIAKSKYTNSTNWIKPDSLGYDSVTTRIPCIAYSAFNNDLLVILKADTIIKKYLVGRNYEWDLKSKKYITCWFSSPIHFMSKDGEITDETQVTYWSSGKRIYPIEIIKTPIIRQYINN